MDGKMSLTVTIGPDENGSLKIVAWPLDETHRFNVNETLLILTFWNERTDLLRGKVEEPLSKSVAYFQGSGGLYSLARLMNLSVERDGSESPVPRSR